MIHDPLVGRRRALFFGIIAVVLVSLGAGVLAWLQPDPRPGEAPIVRSAGDQLFVRVGDTYHPVANLTSARIITGEPTNPVSVGESTMAAASFGPPVGITDAPGYLAEATALADAPGNHWAVCRSELNYEEAETIVRSDDSGIERGLGPGYAALVEDEDGKEWLVDETGRTPLPGPDNLLGRGLRRGLDITPDTPRWQVPSEFLNVLNEKPAFNVPDPLPEVWEADDGTTWARSDNGVMAIETAQARVLTAAGAPMRPVRSSEPAALDDAPLHLNLPAEPLTMLDREDGWLCATGEGGAASMVPTGSVRLSGTAIADRFAGLDTGAIAVNTGHSVHVVSAMGQRHLLPEPGVLAALGLTPSETNSSDGSAEPDVVSSLASAPWDIVRLLPEGSVLDRDRALEATY